MSFDRAIKFELSRLNVHLPEKRLSLKEALSSPKPIVISRDGSIHSFKREELEFLAGIIPKADWDKLRLPIFIVLDPKFGRGSAKIAGEAEVRAICHVLQKKFAGDELLIYRPEVALVRRRLPTTTQYFFAPG